MATLSQLRSSTPNGVLPAYAWPGGYPLEYITKDGLMICPSCANLGEEAGGLTDPVVEGEIFWEGDTYPCEDCGKPISSAYGPLVDTGDDE